MAQPEERHAAHARRRPHGRAVAHEAMDDDDVAGTAEERRGHSGTGRDGREAMGEDTIRRSLEMVDGVEVALRPEDVRPAIDRRHGLQQRAQEKFRAKPDTSLREQSA